MDIDSFLDSAQGQKTPEKREESVPSLDLAPFQTQRKQAFDLFEEQLTAISEHLQRQIDANDYSGAFESFTKLQDASNEMVDFYTQIHARIQSTMNKYKDSLESLYHSMNAGSDKVMANIQQIMIMLRQEVQREDFRTAFGLYSQIQKQYNQIPNEFDRKKTQIHEEILHTYLFMKKEYTVYTQKADQRIVAQTNSTYVQAEKLIEDGQKEEADAKIKEMDSIIHTHKFTNMALRSSLQNKISQLKQQLLTIRTKEKPKEPTMPAAPVVDPSNDGSVPNIAPKTITPKEVPSKHMMTPPIPKSDESSSQQEMKQPFSTPKLPSVIASNEEVKQFPSADKESFVKSDHFLHAPATSKLERVMPKLPNVNDHPQQVHEYVESLKQKAAVNQK